MIDTTFDVRTDAGGRDPDRYSRTLRRFHQQLWSKPLPDGQLFTLDDNLRHESTLGTFRLSSDAITHTYSKRTHPQHLVRIVTQVSSREISDFYALGCTVGAYTLFPLGVRSNGETMPSINQRRGMHPQIQDRFDLTLESIRRHYIGDQSPLTDVLHRHQDFFSLFGSFAGYVEHFLLQDLVSRDYTAVAFWTDREPFLSDPLPAADLLEYREYSRRVQGFIQARNSRIRNYSDSSGTGKV